MLLGCEFWVQGLGPRATRSKMSNTEITMTKGLNCPWSGLYIGSVEEGPKIRIHGKWCEQSL